MGSTPNAKKGLKTSHPPLTTVTSFAAGFSRVFRSFRQPVFPLILTSKTFSNSLRVLVAPESAAKAAVTVLEDNLVPIQHDFINVQCSGYDLR